MIIEQAINEGKRKNHAINLSADLVVAGGGMAGVCAAIAAAREGIKVVLVQDRPVLGGNASSEVRLWILGATSHMGNNNRWAREGGIIDELLIENLYRNKEGNPLIFDTILLEKVREEKNIILLLNTSVYSLEKDGNRRIKKLKAFCSQNSIEYTLDAPLFCDATGDGLIAFQAGAAFRMGAESAEEFGEGMAPNEEYGELLGHSIYFYSKKTEHPVKYVAPSFALKDITKIPRYKDLNEEEYGCRLWWIEYGGKLDTVHDTEKIKWELWKVVYGVWDHIKNSGKFENVDNLTLEWVGTIPGKRESRRFEGEYMLKQQDVINQNKFEDAVAFGGWALDLHPAEGVYSHLKGCTQWHTKGVYQIPYRCYLSRDIDNLFYAGRIISATHVAFGSSRVMATCALGAQAVGMAASLCVENKLLPKDILTKPYITTLQNKLNLTGQSIPNIPIQKDTDLISQASLTASSTYLLNELPFDGEWISVETAVAQMLPLKKDQAYSFKLKVKALQKTELTTELRVSSKKENFTPDITLEQQKITLEPGEQFIEIAFTSPVPEHQYGFLSLLSNDQVFVQNSRQRLTGLLSVFKKVNKAVSNYGFQNPPEGIGIDAFEFWTPQRRPQGFNLAMQITPAIQLFDVEYLRNGLTRPVSETNAWTADLEDPNPIIELRWNEPQKLKGIQLHFDTDFDHPLESSLMGHPESEIPFCVKNYTIRNCNDEVLAVQKDNHQTINKIQFDTVIEVQALKIYLEHPSVQIPAALFEICCF